jgi:hypothetical protein
MNPEDVILAVGKTVSRVIVTWLINAGLPTVSVIFAETVMGPSTRLPKLVGTEKLPLAHTALAVVSRIPSVLVIVTDLWESEQVPVTAKERAVLALIELVLVIAKVGLTVSLTTLRVAGTAGLPELETKVARRVYVVSGRLE